MKMSSSLNDREYAKTFSIKNKQKALKKVGKQVEDKQTTNLTS